MKKPAGLKKARAAAATAATTEPPQAHAGNVSAVAVARVDQDAHDVPGNGLDDEKDDSPSAQADHLREMLAMALAKLADTTVSDDNGDDGGDVDADGAAEEAAMLLRGVVHEADRVLRLRAATISTEQNLSPLPPAFHLVYGEALLRLGLLLCDSDYGQNSSEDNQDEGSNTVDPPDAYFDAAVDRFDVGLESLDTALTTSSLVDDNDAMLWKLHEGTARALIEKANWLARADRVIPAKEIDAIVSTAFNKHISAALSDLSARRDLDECVAILDLLLRHTQFCRDAAAKKKWTNVVRVELNKLVKLDQSHVGLWLLLARTYMDTANGMLDYAEENNSEIDTKTVGKLIDETLKYALRAQDEAKKKGDNENVDIELLATFVNKANLMDENENESEANVFYKKAVKCFKLVNSVDAARLPEAFDTFIREWEAEMEQ
ncbi:hypothetical protein HDU83_002226 [Entophlyctis luteolus]|nr:hypothetical protein HDU83_002226 [Entophlyctis luteolus]